MGVKVLKAAIAAIIDTLVEHDPGVLCRADLERVSERALTGCESFPTAYQWLIRAALTGIEFGRPLFVGRIGRFSRLGLSSRVRCLRRIEGLPLVRARDVLTLLRLVATTALMREPEVLDWVGYTPAWRHRQTHAAELPCEKGASHADHA